MVLGSQIYKAFCAGYYSAGRKPLDEAWDVFKLTFDDRYRYPADLAKADEEFIRAGHFYRGENDGS